MTTCPAIIPDETVSASGDDVQRASAVSASSYTRSRKFPFRELPKAVP